MSATLDALLESADRQNKTNGTITEELKSIGADVRARALEPGLFRKLAPRLDPVALNFTTPVGSSNRPRQQHPSADAKDGRSVLLAQALCEKAKIGDELIEVDDDDEDLARQVVPELTKHERARQAAARGRNTYHRQAALQEFPAVDDDGLAGRDVNHAELPEVEAAVREKCADRQKTTQQIDALIQMSSPKSKQEVQRLTGRVAALNRFISRSTDKCLPFYDTLRKNRKFEWTEKCEDAFRQLKEYLASPPVLAKPVHGEPLFLYRAVSETAVSGVLVGEERGEQKPIFYISKSLTEAETRYPVMEKLALSVLTTARKLRPYFQSHPIVVLSTFPLRSVLHSPSQSSRLAKWAIELSEYNIA
ncbi:hypothetical protein AALP_AA1G180400 [Arabis alpina]|uniref:Reverse transcriptase/retrotransposon-derived protein RNase H-like domain-containing protein n=1 Tax=Arabis alpina TaxID=50452 RepID=A0A087HNY8_ARAAL|nr:hypothetical protein AALP_AA1G180400 [Arabis alpina]